MALSEPLRTAALSCARGTHTVGLLDKAAAWHPTGAEGGLKESWVRTPQGFPEQGWRSAVNPWRQIIESMHATVRLALHIPEAGGLVWVVDGQADSSDVLQSLWREEQSPTSRATYLLTPKSLSWRAVR